MANRKSKYCICKKPSPNYNKENLICNKCKKIIDVKIRKVWKLNPNTKIEKNKKRYNRRRDKRQYEIDINEGGSYDV